MFMKKLMKVAQTVFSRQSWRQKADSPVFEERTVVTAVRVSTYCIGDEVAKFPYVRQHGIDEHQH